MKKHLKKLTKYDLITIVASIITCAFFINLSKLYYAYHKHVILQEKYTYIQNTSNMLNTNFDESILALNFALGIILLIALVITYISLITMFVSDTIIVLFPIATIIGIFCLIKYTPFSITLPIVAFAFTLCALIISNIALKVSGEPEYAKKNITIIILGALFINYFILIMFMPNDKFDQFINEIKIYNTETTTLATYKPIPITLSKSESIKLDTFPNNEVPNNKYVTVKLEDKSTIHLTDTKANNTQKITLDSPESPVSSTILVYPHQQIINVSDTYSELIAYNVDVPTIKLNKRNAMLNLYKLNPTKDTTYNVSFATTKHKQRIDVIQNNKAQTIYTNESELKTKDDDTVTKEITVKKDEVAYVNIIGTKPIEAIVTEK